jgi:pimeloyl-ACP methyl ester carboxylesterase
MPTFDRVETLIHYDDLPGPPRGDRVPVVLCHGLLGTGAVWAPLLGALGAIRRVLTIDLRGHGRSGAAPRQTTLDDLVEDTISLLDHLRIERAALAGRASAG